MRTDWANRSSIVGLPFHPTWREKTNSEGHVKRYSKEGAQKGWSGRKKNKSGGKTREDNKCVDGALTSWAASEDQLTDFIIDEDEQGVREGAEPPVGPGKKIKAGNEKLIRCPGQTRNMWAVEMQSRAGTPVGL